MFTDEMNEAVERLIELCKNPEQVKGMEILSTMLRDFDESAWLKMVSDGSVDDWLIGFIKDGGA